ncbi:odorant receptor 13a-like [Phymastichus coffea]|uniref:odorant receptor 13a-like n=1 Tax=Phymastichus coffea TaxID=108790 RepID=UPI00273BFDA1|nr:odorant receptor 13a-like [Phymastichus coffea]
MPNYAEQDNLAAVDKKEIQQNVDLSLAITRRLLQMIGLWPYATYSKVWRMLLIALVSFVLMFVAVPAALYVAIVVNDLEMRLQLLGPLSFVCMNIFKYFAVLFQEDQLEQCIERITNDWRMVCSQMKNYLMRENVKYAKSFTTVCVTCTYMGVMSYGMFFSFVMDPIIVGNNTYRIFAFPSHFIFFNSFDYFKLIYTIQMMCVFALCTITLSVESIGISCAMHICGQINVIAWIMRSLAADTFDKASFGRIVEKHLRAIAFAKELENFLNGMCFVEFVGSCFNICMLGYYMIMAR